MLLSRGIGTVLILTVIVSGVVSAQDSVSVISFKARPHLTIDFARRNQVIDIRHTHSELPSVKYLPNSLFNVVASIDYGWLSLSAGLLKVPANPASGKTKQYSFATSFNGKRIWNTNFIQSYRGFYIKNPMQPEYGLPASGLHFRPDIYSFTLFGNLDYCFNPENFSYRAALWQLDRQEKSAGSFVAGVSYNFNLILSDSSLIPPGMKPYFKSSDLIVSRRLTNFALHGGYIHTFVPRKYWFITLYLFPGITLQGGSFLAEDKLVRNYNNQLSLTGEFRLIAGYNGEQWFSGVSFHSLNYSDKSNIDVWIDNSYNWFRVFAGYRFKSLSRNKPALIKKIGL